MCCDLRRRYFLQILVFVLISEEGICPQSCESRTNCVSFLMAVTGAADKDKIENTKSMGEGGRCAKLFHGLF